MNRFQSNKIWDLIKNIDKRYWINFFLIFALIGVIFINMNSSKLSKYLGEMVIKTLFLSYKAILLPLAAYVIINLLTKSKTIHIIAYVALLTCYLRFNPFNQFHLFSFLDYFGCQPAEANIVTIGSKVIWPFIKESAKHIGYYIAGEGMFKFITFLGGGIGTYQFAKNFPYIANWIAGIYILLIWISPKKFWNIIATLIGIFFGWIVIMFPDLPGVKEEITFIILFFSYLFLYIKTLAYWGQKGADKYIINPLRFSFSRG